ncbi:MAG TPA: sulfotransferase [Rhodanobacter sp.]|jgi:tetratricopeptide (TPR) repeat protein|nr:sulfotransferase [Rhodanobacter sp.]
MNSRLQGLEASVTTRILAAGEALDAGRVNDAELQLAQARARHPNHPEILRMQAGIHDLRGQHQMAIQLMQSALAQRPRDPLYHNTMGVLLGNAGEYEAAIRALKSTCELLPDMALAWYNLGVMLTKCVRNDEAVQALQRAVALEPAHLAARALLADILRTRGEADAASIEYRRLIEIRPTEGMAWWGLADLRTHPFTDADAAQMRAALRSEEANELDRVAIGFALAKALDDTGDYAGSLAALAEANVVARRHQTWDAKAFSNQVAAVGRAFEEQPAVRDGPLGREVIFVVGLPRSGTTLVEQILASHSSVQGAGELPDLPQVLAEESRRRGEPFPQWIGEIQAADWERLGQRYLDRTARWRRERPYFVDKLPNNWIYVDAIRAMLPSAHIVVCRRDPLETCFSCYRQHLDGSNGYTRTFEDVASFWRNFDASVERSAARHPGHVLQHSYEMMLREPEAQIRGLLEFCGLPFEASCLAFHENVREVRSPSATQVRQPLRQDTARATKYGSLLDSLRHALHLPPWES